MKNVILQSFIILLFFLSSCLPLGGKQQKTSGRSFFNSLPDSTVIPSAVPTISGGVPYLQSESTKTTDVLEILPTFKDSFYLRGTKVHELLLQDVERLKSYCLIFHFPFSNKTLALKAVPQYFEYFSQKTREYYFHIYATDDKVNENHCNKAAVTSKTNVKYPGSTLVYLPEVVCTQCLSSITSQKAFLVDTTTGVTPTFFTVEHLSLRLRGTEENDKPGSCDSARDCQELGYDCCINRQCAKDRTLRPGIDQTSTSFLQAKADLVTNPENIFSYPEFYYVCPIDIDPTPTVIPTANQGQEAVKRLQELKEIYECTNPVEENSELGYCTITFANAKDKVAAPTPTPFFTGADDRNFQSTYMGNPSTNLSKHSIVHIQYAGQTLFKNRTPVLSGFEIDTNGNSNTTNDTITDAQKVTITRPLSKSAPHSDVKITYQIDASCKAISTTLAQCDKYFIQAQNNGKVTDHVTNEKEFILPYYADTAKAITVTVDGYPTSKSLHWELQTAPQKLVRFLEFNETTLTGMSIFDSQVVRLSFYVNLSNFNVLQEKKTAIDKINEMCNCGTGTCSLKPVYQTINQQETLVNYACVYPTPIGASRPLQVTLPISSKTAPHRYYDALGVGYDEPNKSTSGTQEGSLFEYKNKNLLTPNNYEKTAIGELIDVGFNEIYGSYNFLQDAAKPPKVVNLVVGRQYDIITNSGVFSSCQSCGTDYYNIINKIFPENFAFKGGGYTPDPTKTDRKASNLTGEGQYRSDELLFGRACFVPATMIPWTHRKLSDIAQQRKNRLAAQHFLFTNGYHRDWYGFDYGALIGSFDGVAWFAIGNQRRIKARTNKLYIAVNAYFSDLAQNNDFSITISEVAPVANSGSNVTEDLNNDGAQCQRFHLCQSDKDCITQLGWDYSCQTVSGIKTKWPYFDANGREIPNTERIYNLIDILTGFSGQNKRCVYRGVGSPCLQDYIKENENSSFDSTTIPGLHACTPNSYCQNLAEVNGDFTEYFNRRLSRFGKGTSAQNTSPDLDKYGETDSFGLGARFIGRPYSYHGQEKVTESIRAQLSYNRIKSLCLPGRNTDESDAETFLEQHQVTPTNEERGDKILNIGHSSRSTLGKSLNYLSACSILDTEGNYMAMQSGIFAKTLLSSSTSITFLSAAQSVSTNVLKKFQHIGGSDDRRSEIDLLLDPRASFIDSEGLQENRCLRLAGSPCFTSLDCAPSKTISMNIANVEPEEVDISEAEYRFWREDLICGQKNPPTGADYDLKNNVCCRETGKILTIDTSRDQDVINTEKIPQINLDDNASNRYFRLAPSYPALFNKSPSDSNIYPQIRASIDDACVLDTADDFTETAYDIGRCSSTDGSTTSTRSKTPVFRQYNTIDLVAKRTCCSGNWVRNFHKEKWGGGHTWTNTFRQNFDIANFRCLGWKPTTTSSVTAFTCTNPADNSACQAHSLQEAEMDNLSKFFSSLELLGIPQVMIKSTKDASNNTHTSVTKRLSCYVKNDDTQTAPVGDLPIPDTIKISANSAAIRNTNTAENAAAEYRDANTNYTYFSAADPENFSDNLEMMFSENEFSCCLPGGEIFPFTITGDQCCTGTKFPTQNRCCLPDYTNVSVYINRYVSSEANNVAPQYFEALTGAPISPSFVQQIVNDKNLCCSGRFAPGTAIGRLPVPGAPSDATNRTRRRFLYLNTDANFSNWQLGRRWNTDIYCIP